jgi:hypothetical protein
MGEDRCRLRALNESVGSLSQPAALFLAWPPEAGLPSSQLHDLAVTELAEEWELEFEALRRRAKLRVVRDEQDLASAT